VGPAIEGVGIHGRRSEISRDEVIISLIVVPAKARTELRHSRERGNPCYRSLSAMIVGSESAADGFPLSRE
jgi:hypothetical protein